MSTGVTIDNAVDLRFDDGSTIDGDSCSVARKTDFKVGVFEMAKGQRRSGREPKKPKQNKTKATAAASPFAAIPAGKPAPTGKRR